MLTIKCNCLVLFIFFTIGISGQLTIYVAEIPDNTPINDPIHIAGDFQGWNPSDTAYQLFQNEKGKFIKTLSIDSGYIVFKLTRGSWLTVEGDQNGNKIKNRSYHYKGGKDTVKLSVLSWQSNVIKPQKSTAQSNVYVISDTFNIPQLKRDRRIWIYLPPDYNDSLKYYPVLYMHDGQNLFDESTSYSGEWAIDETLNRLHELGDYGVIVVGIDHGKEFRMNEYSPWINSKYGGGEGANYMKFIVETLKPYIDKNYLTLSDRKFTGIMGSSMGGLITLYGGIEHQEIFSKLGVFSPSLWFSPNIFQHVKDKAKLNPMKIYSIMGIPEGGTAVKEAKNMNATLLNIGYTADEVKQLFHLHGQHNEEYWANEFSDAYLWMFGDLDFTAIPLNIK